VTRRPAPRSKRRLDEGFLQHQYGVDLDRITWVCTDDPHLAEYHDLAIVERAPSGYDFGDGRIDAAILGKDLPKNPDIRSLIPDPSAAARAWHAENQAIPINHVFVVDADLSRQRPDIVRELYRLLAESKARDATGADGIDMKRDLCLPLPRGQWCNHRHPGARVRKFAGLST
jgi:4,5-dihydroxyphthalate decarboxylase